MTPAPFDKTSVLRGKSILLRAATPDDADFVVLRDPDGNELCVIQHDRVPGFTP